MVIHVKITEENKNPGDNIGRLLKISGDTYESLDEI